MRYVLLPIALLTLPALAPAQVFGPETALIEPMPSIAALTIADFDGDGDNDIVGHGAMAFPPAPIPTSVWIESLGSGQLAAQRALMPTDFTRKSDAVLADVDGDGDQDVFFCGIAPASVGWMENLGDGTFDGPNLIASSSFFTNQIEAADLNGDGRIDVVVKEQSFRLSWFENLGGGSFSGRQVLGDNIGQVTSFDVADLDADGDTDVVFSEFSASEIRWFEQTSSGSFTADALVTDRINRPTRLKVRDLNGDGVLDLIAGDESPDEVVWSRGLGASAYAASQTIYAPSSGVVATYEIADLNGDGQLDVAASSTEAPVVQILRSGSTFLAPTELATSLASRQVIQTADIDGDGRLDLVTAAGGSVHVFPGSAAGFDEREEPYARIESRRTHITADLNEDGLADLVLAGTPAVGGFEIFLGQGSGQWGVPSRSYDTFGLGDLAALDLDGDGDLDVVASGGSFDSVVAFVAWAENLGDGTFADLSVLHSDLGDGEAVFAVGDLEGDGDLDVLTVYPKGFTGLQDDRVVWIEQTSAGTFAGGLDLADNELPENVALADVDADGIADAVIGRSTTTGGSLVWRRGDGLGQFGPEVVIRDGSFPVVESVASDDVNNDGRVDLVISGPGGIELYLWDSSLAGFAPPALLGPGIAELRIADVTSDGLVDIFASAPATPARWIENLGSGAFAAPQVLPEDVGFSTVLGVGDYDGDLDMDILKSRRNEGIAWNENLSRFGFSDCVPAEPNSTGDWGAISASGSRLVTDNDVTLLAERLPPGSFGYFLISPNRDFVPAAGGSQGNLCLGSPIGRLNRGQNEIFQTGAGGAAGVVLDLTNVPTPTGAVALVPGDTRYFQAWFRDANPAATSNFTNALRVTFE